MNPLERKFLKYSTKFLCPNLKTPYWEKFTLLDNKNLGYVNFKATPEETNYRSDESSEENSEASDEEDSGSHSKNEGKETQNVYQVTYSDYLAAIFDSEILCGEINIELLFHTLSPSYMTNRIMKDEMGDALF